MPNELPRTERWFELPPRAFTRQYGMEMDGLRQLTAKISRTLSIVAAWQAAYDLGVVKFGGVTSDEMERLLELKHETDRIVREWGIK